jgi:hypothetical protein
MPVQKFRPTSPGRRGASGYTFDEITKKKPEKSLLVSKKRSAGRSAGKISVRHRGGGAKRRIRIIDFKRDKIGVPGTVRAIEYDPEPLGAHRAGVLRGRRQALHPGPGRAEGGHGDRERGRRGRSRRATPCRCPPSPPARPCTTWR